MKAPVISWILCAAISMGMATSRSAHADGGFSPLTPLTSTTLCNRCVGYWLPGELFPSPRTVYRIDSDLPEMYYSNGVLYATTAVLPPMKTKDGEDIPEAMRRQKNNGFSAIDDSFEVFLYHLSQNHAPGETRRIVVYAKNIGAIPAVLAPRQAMFHGPNAGKLDSVESQLGNVVLQEHWEHPVHSFTLEPGKGGIVGYTKQLGAGKNSADETPAVFVTGMLRADMGSQTSERPKLELYVVSIPGNTPRAEWVTRTESLLGIGAQSGENSMNLLIPPPTCHVRRVVGTSRNAMWRNQPFHLNVEDLSPEGISFLMALPKVQSGGCEQARQTADLLLHPPYVHSDTVGNYMMEYYLVFRLTNPGEVPRKVDLRFGKTDARIGLAWQAVVGDMEKLPDEFENQPVRISWAGKGTPGLSPPFYSARMLMNKEGDEMPLNNVIGLHEEPIAPGDTKVISMRLMVLGTSSLPYHLIFTPVP